MNADKRCMMSKLDRNPLTGPRIAWHLPDPAPWECTIGASDGQASQGRFPAAPDQGGGPEAARERVAIKPRPAGIRVEAFSIVHLRLTVLHPMSESQSELRQVSFIINRHFESVGKGSPI